jgi:CheY-like chemotaxis protein
MTEDVMQIRDMFGILQGADILVVDDHAHLIDSIHAILEAAGVRVTIACNGAMAFSLLCDGNFCCVLTDIQMPVMDGIELARIIRSTPAIAGVPLIAMSANATSDLCELWRSAGGDDFISKPFRANELFTKLSVWLIKPHSSRNL